MGLEAICQVEWAGASGEGKVLIETRELILRGGKALPWRSVPIASLTQIEARGDRLYFRIGEDAVALTLGAKIAENWAKKLSTPPATLAAKLGITGETHLALMGNFDTDELAAAVAVAASIESRQPDLVLARGDVGLGRRARK